MGWCTIQRWSAIEGEWEDCGAFLNRDEALAALHERTNSVSMYARWDPKDFPRARVLDGNGRVIAKKETRR